MEFIKSFLRKIDIFGVPYAFKYKSEDKYTTPLGGFVVILFISATIILGVYYFIPFYNRNNFTAVYYTLKTAQADMINFDESKTGLAFGLNCWTGNDGTTAQQLFKIDYKYIYWKLEDNNYNRDISALGIHPCTKKDFYNDFNETFDSSKIYDYQCLDNPSTTIEGIWTSEIFSYFQFEVNAKNNSKELLNKIDNYLHENDCKFQIFYSDHTVDINDYHTPIKSYVEAIFIQLNPTLSIRRNLYFMNQYLFDDDYLMWVFPDDDEEFSTKKTLFSRYEEYSLFQGLERNKNYTDYLNFVKLYIRADTKLTEVKRRYQKINEFCADASSLLITLYELLIIIFEYLNTFWSEQSLSKNIFFFKDFDDKLNINDKTEKIRELLYVTNGNKNNLKHEHKILNTEISEKPNTIQIFQEEKVLNTSKKGKRSTKNTQNYNNILTNNEESLTDIDYNNEKLSNSYRGREYNLNSKNNINEMNYIKKSRKNDIYQSTQFTENNLYTVTKDKETSYEENEEEDIKYDYNLFHKIRTLICKFCLSKELKIKNDLTEKANSILDSKLDIVLYVRNMMLLDIMNEMFIDSETKEILNFLARPVVSLKHNEENELALFCHKYEKTDFEQFYKEVIQLSNKTDKRKEDIKLISICNRHLNKYI